MKTGHIAALLALAFSLFPLIAGHAQIAEAGGAIAGSAAMSSVVKNIHAAISDIIEKLDNSVGSATFLARSNMQLILGDLDYQSKDVAGKTFGELNKSQQEFFNNLQITINELGGSAQEVAEKTDKILQRAEFLMGTVPFANREPRLRSHSPVVFVYDKEKLLSGVDLKFDGSWLAHGTPSLKMNDQLCAIEDQKEVSLRFKCKFDKYEQKPYNDILVGSLSLPTEKSFLEKIYAIFGYKGSNKSYPTSFEVLPKKFADIIVVANQENFTKNENVRSAAFDTGARHCISGPSTTLNISRAGPEWEIDVNSIVVNVTSSNGGRHQVNNVSNVGFQVNASASNHGDCGPFWKDARGWHSGVVTWKEIKKVPTIAPVEVQKSEIVWGEKKILNLPQHTKSYVVTIRRFDGIVRQYNAKGKDAFVKIGADASNTALDIEVVDVARAFR